MASRYYLGLISSLRRHKVPQRSLASPTSLLFSHRARSFYSSPVSSLTALPETKHGDAILPVLDRIQTKTTTSYNSLLKELALEGRSSQAQKLYDSIFRSQTTVRADVETYSQLMLAYINDGLYEDAMDIYYELRDYESKDLAKIKQFRLDADTYSAMIQSLTQMPIVENLHSFDAEAEPLYAYTVEDGDDAILNNIEGDSQPSLLTALTLFNDMRRLEIQPTSDMYLNMLKACTEQKDGFVLERLHKLLRMDVYLDPDIRILNQLMEAYSAINDGSTTLEIWDTIEPTMFNADSVSIVLKVCLDHGYFTRANMIWNTIKLKQPELKLPVEDFNNYLTCVLKSKDISAAENLVQEGLISGIADESSASGTGRTTFVNTLCDADVLPKKVCDNPEEAHIEEGVAIKPVSVELDEDGVRISLTIVDTPGFGDNIDNEKSFQEIAGYLETQYDDILAEESRIKRNPRFRDNRVHALLYFVSPTGHALREIDIELMRRLSPRVNVIPVIGRADSLTPQELKDFKKRIMEDIDHYNIRIYNFPYDVEEDDEDTIEENSELRALLPFSIIGSDEEIIINGRAVRGRSYPWGSVEGKLSMLSSLDILFSTRLFSLVDNPRHSDFGRLRSALLSSHLQDLKEITHDILYENYRTEKLSRTVHGGDQEDAAINLDDMNNQSMRLKEEHLRKEEEKLREIELKVQREIQEKRAELLSKEEALRSLEARLSQAQLTDA
ncbi:Septin spn3 [Choanephora cucurbitarum]|uniref:Septin spn3 n=1 Tax=Choanephora cucurbitarum TaxID=101091 RepID=A0A1C7NG84_9FUNG|nr:Septin spn3 [Choanephora cucurbitarum]